MLYKRGQDAKIPGVKALPHSSLDGFLVPLASLPSPGLSFSLSSTLTQPPSALWLGSFRRSCAVFPGGEEISLRSVPQRNVPPESVLLFQPSPRVFDPFHEGMSVLLVWVHCTICWFHFPKAPAAHLPMAGRRSNEDSLGPTENNPNA